MKDAKLLEQLGYQDMESLFEDILGKRKVGELIEARQLYSKLSGQQRVAFYQYVEESYFYSVIEDEHEFPLEYRNLLLDFVDITD